MTKLALFLSVFAAVFSAGAAFDENAWLAKRQRMTGEAHRLRRAYADCSAKIETPAEDVSVSIETFPDGTVKTAAFARRAQFFPEADLVWAEGVVLKKYKKDGSLDARLDAENCVIDRNSHSGWAEGAAKVAQGTTVFSGKRVYFSSRESYVKVFADTDMESRDLKTKGGFR